MSIRPNKTPSEQEAGNLRHTGNPPGGAYRNPLDTYQRIAGPTESSTPQGTPYGSTVPRTAQDLFVPPELLLPPRHPHDQPPLAPSTAQLDAMQEAVRVRQRPQPRTARFGDLYDSLRTRDGWRYRTELAADGTITPSAAGPVTSPIVVPTNQYPAQAMMQYPGGAVSFVVMTMFSYAVTAGGMAGALVWYWLDGGGKLIPLISAGGADTSHEVSPTALSGYRNVDPTGAQLELGSIYVKMVSGATPVLCAWQVGFSIAYLLPDEHPYGVRGEWDSIHADARHRAEDYRHGMAG